MADDTWEARLSSALDELQDAEDAIAAALARRDDVKKTVVSLIAEARGENSEVSYVTFRRAIRHIYWERPYVGAKDLAVASGFPSPAEISRVAGPIPSGKPCRDCGNDIPKTSRSWSPRMHPVCDSCHDEIRRGNASNA